MRFIRKQMKILKLNACLNKSIVSFSCEHLKNVKSQVLKNVLSKYTQFWQKFFSELIQINIIERI